MLDRSTKHRLTKLEGKRANLALSILFMLEHSTKHRLTMLEGKSPQFNGGRFPVAK